MLIKKHAITYKKRGNLHKKKSHKKSAKRFSHFLGKMKFHKKSLNKSHKKMNKKHHKLTKTKNSKKSRKLGELIDDIKYGKLKDNKRSSRMLFTN